MISDKRTDIIYTKNICIKLKFNIEKDTFAVNRIYRQWPVVSEWDRRTMRSERAGIHVEMSGSKNITSKLLTRLNLNV